VAESKHGSLLADVLTSARARAQVAEDSLARLSEAYSPEALFAAALTTMLMVPEGVPAEPARGTVPAKAERLAFHLWRHPGPGSTTPDTDALNAVLAATERLHSAAVTLVAGSNTTSDPVHDLLARVAMDVHTIRGSAYARQTADEIKSIAGQFDPWFEARLGCTASGLVDAVLAIAATTEEDLAEWMNRVVNDTRARLGRPRSSEEKQAFSGAVLHVLASDMSLRRPYRSNGLPTPRRVTPLARGLEHADYSRRVHPRARASGGRRRRGATSAPLRVRRRARHGCLDPSHPRLSLGRARCRRPARRALL
jgi:hypothetical protein